MAYLRGTIYIWSPDKTQETGETVFCNKESCVRLPQWAVDAYCAMRWAEMTEAQREAACRFAVEHGLGNFGADRLCATLGIPTAMDWIKDVVAKVKRREGPPRPA